MNARRVSESVALGHCPSVDLGCQRTHTRGAYIKPEGQRIDRLLQLHGLGGSWLGLGIKSGGCKIGETMANGQMIAQWSIKGSPILRPKRGA